MAVCVLTGALVLAFAPTSAGAPYQSVAGGDTLATSTIRVAGLEAGRAVPIDCADGGEGVVVHNVRLVARRAVVTIQGAEQRVREIEVRYEQFETCTFTGTVEWGTLTNQGVYWQPRTKRAAIRARIPLRDSVTGLPSGVAVIRVTLVASETPTRTVTLECLGFDGQFLVSRVVERLAPADASGRVRIGGVNILPISEFVAGTLRTRSARASAVPC